MGSYILSSGRYSKYFGTRAIIMLVYPCPCVFNASCLAGYRIMSDQPKNRFAVTPGAKASEPARDRARDVGHYFDQGFFERQQSLLAARAATMALNDELVKLGVEIDPKTGEVRMRSA